MASAARRSTTARKIVGSLAVIGTAAAIAGLGAFGTFTDSATSVTKVDSGVLSYDLSAPGGIPHTIPVTTEGFVPGDSLTRAINLKNEGDVALSSVRLATSAAPVTALTSDPVNGLRLALEHCSRRWTNNGTTALPSYTCDGTQRSLYSGPFVSTAELALAMSLTPGGADNLVFTLTLPSTAGNDMQSLRTTVGLTFTAVQAPGAPR